MINGSGTAVLFPGQGAYYRTAVADLRDGYEETTTIFSEIDEAVRPILGRSVLKELLATPGPELDEWMRRPPDVLQLTLYGIAVSAYRAMHARGLRPDVLVGHSFGEIAALVSGGAFTVSEGAEIVCHRTDALRQSKPRDGYMCALGTDAAVAQRLLDLVGDPNAVVAVANHPRQTVVSGPAETLDKIVQFAAIMPVNATRLKSPYPFHSPLLTTAAADFAGRIRHLRPRPLTTEVYSPIAGRAYCADDELTEQLAAHLTQPVRFADALRALAAGGITVFVESGALDALARITHAALGSEIQAVPALMPEAEPAKALEAGLARLAAAGVIAPQRPTGQPSLQELFRQLVPGVSTQAIEDFWAQRGDEVLALVRDDFYRYRAAADNAGHGHDAHVGSANGVAAEADGATLTVVSSAPVAASAAPTVGPDRGQVLGQLVEMYAEALEYPTEVFAEDTDLEGELGVDSVKQMELLTRVSSRYGLPERPPQFRASGVNTLGRIADLVVVST